MQGWLWERAEHPGDFWTLDLVEACSGHLYSLLLATWESLILGVVSANEGGAA